MTGHRQPWYLDRLRGELERVAAIEDQRERSPTLGRLRPALDRMRPSPRMLAALAAVLALVAVVLAVARESDVERPVAAPQPTPGKKVLTDVTDVDDAVRWRLDGRVLTVQLLPFAPDRTVRMVNGTRISATCGTNVALSPADPRRETTLTRLWPAGQTSLSYRFPRDVSEWCRLADPAGRRVAFVRFPGASSAAGPAAGLVTETALKWARLFASSPGICNEYMVGQPVCEQMMCQRVGAPKPIPNCTRPNQAYTESFRGATVQEIAIKGDEAAARFSNGETIRLHWQPNGDWGVTKIGGDAGRGIFE
jgi:hypothetical protein